MSKTETSSRPQGLDPRRANLNLLPALEALLETRSVTAAARRTRVSQSAMSHSLAKLRDLLDDPLLVPAGRGFVLSPRAAELAETLRPALDQLARTLTPAPPFDPATTRRTFRLATLDYFEVAMVGDFMEYFRKHAPHAEVWIERASAATVGALERGELDVALVGETSLPRSPALARAELFRDPFRVLLRRGHPALPRKGKRVPLAAYLAYPHVVVTVEGRADGAVDRALERTGAHRTVALRVPHFGSAPLAVLGGDALSTIASSVAERARSLYGLEVREPPIALPDAGIVAVWAKRSESDAAATWFRDLFLEGHAVSRHVRSLMRARPS